MPGRGRDMHGGLSRATKRVYCGYRGLYKMYDKNR